MKKANSGYPSPQSMADSGSTDVPSIDAPKAPMNTTKVSKSFDFGEEVEAVKGKSSAGSPRSQRRAAYLMKRDPMEEFFELTCKSIILNSPHMNAICTVNTKEMYKKAL